MKNKKNLTIKSNKMPYKLQQVASTPKTNDKVASQVSATNNSLKEMVIPNPQSRISYFIKGSTFNKSSFIGADFTADSESDENIGYYQQAEMLLDQITSGIYSIGRLTISQKKILFFYLSVFSPIVSRIIDLHTKLPLSTLRLQKPKHEIDIVQDFIYDYFDDLIESNKFKSELRNLIRNRWIFGYGLGKIEDDYHFNKDTIIDSSLESISLPQRTEEQMSYFREINARYNQDPSSVTTQEKKEVLKGFLLNINPDYKGIKSFNSVPILDVDSISINSDIDYKVYSIPKSQYMKNYLQSNASQTIDQVIKDLKSIGYSEAMIRANLSDTEKLEIDSDPFNEDGMYITALSSGSESMTLEDSILNRILDPAIRHLQAIRTANELINLSSKVDRIVSVPQASADQLAQIQEDLLQMASAPEGSLVIVNHEVQVSELSLDMKDKVDVSEAIERTQNEIASALGLPLDIISGEGGSYGGSFIKVELLSNEYVEFRNQLKSFIEDEILKPIAIKKGFISVNEWGDVVPIIPSVRFDKFSISRQSEDIALIKDLVQEGSLHKGALLTMLGFNVEDVEQAIQRERTTVLSNSVQDAINNSISQILEDKVSNDPEFVEKLLQGLGFNADNNNQTNEEGVSDEY